MLRINLSAHCFLYILSKYVDHFILSNLKWFTIGSPEGLSGTALISPTIVSELGL